MTARTGLLILLALGGWALPGSSQTVQEHARRQQARCAAAAEVDARANLTDRIGRLQITAELTVSQWAEGNDRVAEALAELVESLQVGPARHYADGTCEVELEIDTGRLVAALARMQQQFGGAGAPPADFDAMAEAIVRETIWAVGEGTPDGPAGGQDGQPGDDQAVAEIPPNWAAISANGRLDARNRARRRARMALLGVIRRIRLESGATVAQRADAEETFDNRLRAFVAEQAEREYRWHTARYQVDCVIEVAPSAVGEMLHRLDPNLAISAIAEALPAEAVTVTGSAELAQAYRPDARDHGRTPPPADWPEVLWVAGEARIDPDNPDTQAAARTALHQAGVEAQRMLDERMARLALSAESTVGDQLDRGAQLAEELRLHRSSARLVRQRIVDGERAEVTLMLPTGRIWRIVQYWSPRRGER